MSEFVISTRYASALLNIAQEKGILEDAINSIETIKNTLDDSKELRLFLSNPIIKTDIKSNVLSEIFKKIVIIDVDKFLELILEKGRESLLHDICKRFISLSNEKLNRVDVDIVSAIELTEIQKSDIELKIKNIINKEVISNYKVDQKIIGGFKAKYHDTVIDASIEHQLKLLKHVLFKEDHLKN